MNAPVLRHVLVIHLREIGDVLVATPVFAALRRRFPGVRITAVVQKKCMEMLTCNPDVDDILPVVKWHESSGGVVRGAIGELGFLNRVRRLGVDAVVDLTANDRSSLIVLASGASIRVGRRRRKGAMGRNKVYTRLVAVNSHQHMVGQLLEVLKGLDLVEAAGDYRLRLEVGAGDVVRVDELLPVGVVPIQVHPTSRIPKKCWSPDKMREVVRTLTERGEKVVVTTGPDERELAYAAEMLRGVPGEGVINLAGKVTLKELAVVSGRSRLFIGVDSAPMHMAAAMGTPVLALFGPSDETMWAPWGRHGLAVVPMGCRPPCRRKRDCPTIACMTELMPEHVLQAMDALLKT